MGNDIDICSKDEHLKAMFEEQLGPRNESTWQFFTRTYNKFCESIVNPKRFHYTEQDLIYKPPYSRHGYKESYKENYDWEILEFKTLSQGISLHSCFWKYKSLEDPTFNSDTCILYFHTNIRSLADAIEILPLAAKLKACVIAVDFPGCGKSEGQLNGNLYKDIEHMLDWVECLVGINSKVIIWARGLAISPAITFLGRYSQNKSAFRLNIVSSVLDSPFTSVEEMVQSAITKMGSKGYTLPKTLIQILISTTLKSMTKKLGGLNLFSIKPLTEVHLVKIPCVILSASDDDYIPENHGERIKRHWGGPVQWYTFPGKHFTPRDVKTISLGENFLRSFLELENLSRPSKGSTLNDNNDNDLKAEIIENLPDLSDIVLETPIDLDLLDDPLELVEIGESISNTFDQSLALDQSEAKDNLSSSFNFVRSLSQSSLKAIPSTHVLYYRDQLIRAGSCASFTSSSNLQSLDNNPSSS